MKDVERHIGTTAMYIDEKLSTNSQQRFLEMSPSKGFTSDLIIEELEKITNENRLACFYQLVQNGTFFRIEFEKQAQEGKIDKSANLCILSTIIKLYILNKQKLHK